MADGKEKRLQVTHVNIRQSISFLLMKFISIDILSALIFIAIFAGIQSTDIVSNTDFPVISYTYVMLIILSLGALFLNVYVVLEWLNEYYEITPHAVFHKRGVFFKKEDRYTFQNIKMISIEQGVFGKMLNYGTIVMLDWRLQKYADLYLIHNPMKYLHILEEVLPNVDEQKSTIREHVIERDDE